MRPKRSIARTIGNPLTMLQEPRAKGERGDAKYSGYRVNLFLLVIAFVWNFPSEWNAWSFAAVAVLATALAIRDLMKAIPMQEMFAALTAWFGGVVGKRTKKTTIEEEEPVPEVSPVASVPEAPHEWADGRKDDGLA